MLSVVCFGARDQLKTIMPQSALIIAVPEAEPVVADFRERFDPAAHSGVPAHITVLFPFMSPKWLDAGVIERLRAVATGRPAFSFRMKRIGRFPNILYLKPEPAAPFIAMTDALCAQFPDFPPYEGQFEEIIPHLTVANGHNAQLNRIEADLRASSTLRSGINAQCKQIALIENSTGRWVTKKIFPLATTTVTDVITTRK